MPKTKLKELEIGDFVKILDIGRYYPSWQDAAELLGATLWRANRSPRQSEIGEIKNYEDVKFAKDEYRRIYLVRVSCGEILIGREGIEKASEWDDEHNKH
jgi:hypothetical protein